jgi:Zinc finger C-x8-C-x5-C-x3-H type (and similar)
MKGQIRLSPKIDERCRRWLRNECNLGYQCRFVHEDLEYDVSPVSFNGFDLAINLLLVTVPTGLIQVLKIL